MIDEFLLDKLKDIREEHDIKQKDIAKRLNVTKYRFKMLNNNILDKKIIGQNIKKVRLDNDITQKELATILHTNQSVISAYESGKTLILTAFAIELCLKYHVSLDKLCNRK